MIVFRQPSNRPTVSISQLKLLPTDWQIVPTDIPEVIKNSKVPPRLSESPPLYYTNAGEIRVVRAIWSLCIYQWLGDDKEHLVRDVAVQSSLGNRPLPSKRGQCWIMSIWVMTYISLILQTELSTASDNSPTRATPWLKFGRRWISNHVLNTLTTSMILYMSPPERRRSDTHIK